MDDETKKKLAEAVMLIAKVSEELPEHVLEALTDYGVFSEEEAEDILEIIQQPE